MNLFDIMRKKGDLTTMKEELLKGLNEEQIAKIKACKNQEEMLALAKQEGIELTNEQLEAVSGGICTSYYDCKYCDCHEVTGKTYLGKVVYTCPKCGSSWEVYGGCNSPL